MTRLRRSLLGALWTVGGLLALLFLLRSFVADVYRVESGSMEPFLRGGEAWGEWVLVDYGLPDDLQRFDLIVTYEGSGKPVVKRVVALSGETVQVRDGDLFVEGKRLSAAVARPQPIVLFDSNLHGVEAHFAFDPGRWSRDVEHGIWSVDPSPGPSEKNLLHWRSAFDDGYLLPDDTRVAGARHVGDGLVSCEFHSVSASVRLELREAGDLFRAVVECFKDGRTVLDSDGSGLAETAMARLRIERHHPDHAVEVLAASEAFPCAFGATGVSWPRATFANVDNTLTLTAAGHRLGAEYVENRPPVDRSVVPGVTVGTQVAIGADGGGASFRNIRTARDLHWIAKGDFGVDRPLSLGPGEVFVLGDNSANSLDGRSYGATRLEAILGRPASVVWPRSRARALRGDLWVPLPAVGTGGKETLGSPQN